MKVTNLIPKYWDAATRIDWWHMTVDDVPMVYQAMESGTLTRTCWGTFFDCQNPKKETDVWIEIPYYLPLDTNNPQKTLKHLKHIALLQQ